MVYWGDVYVEVKPGRPSSYGIDTFIIIRIPEYEGYF